MSGLLFFYHEDIVYNFSSPLVDNAIEYSLQRTSPGQHYRYPGITRCPIQRDNISCEKQHA